MQDGRTTPSRRDLLALIGTLAGSTAMYHAMTSLGFAADSTYRGPLELSGEVKGASVLILGAGLAGMTAALELRQAGYRVQVLEFNGRAGGRNWTLRGGDSFTELGGFTQVCEFAPGLYFNPGPWRIPYHHRALLDYCRRLEVALEPFVEINHNAFLHATGAFGGRPQRIRDIKADFHGHVAELLAKVTQQGELDRAVSDEDKEILLEALRSWGALDENYAYRAGLASADARGFAKPPGGGLGAAPVPGEPIGLSELLQSRLWRFLQIFAWYELQTTMFQPVGGMDMIGKAFAREVGDLIRYDAKVTRIKQNERGVVVTYVDPKTPDVVQTAEADWCVCTIPLSVLSQIEIDVGSRMKAAIDAVPYMSAVKIGLQFKRRFWEEDDAIYGGISYTNLPIRQIAYPNMGFNRGGRGILLGAYVFEGANAYEFTAMAPAGTRGASRQVRRGPASAIRRGIRERRRRGLASRAVHARAAPAAGPRRRGRRITMICARSTAGSCLPASTRRICPLGRRARSSRRSMRSPVCTNVSSRRRPVIRWGTRCDVKQSFRP